MELSAEEGETPHDAIDMTTSERVSQAVYIFKMHCLYTWDLYWYNRDVDDENIYSLGLFRHELMYL